MHCQIFAASHKHRTMRGGGEGGFFWCKKGHWTKHFVPVLYSKCSHTKLWLRDNTTCLLWKVNIVAARFLHFAEHITILAVN